MDLNNNSDLSRLKCDLHQRQIEFLYLKDDSKNKLACSRCMIEYKLDYESIIDIEQLHSQKQETIINNLPPNLSQELISQLKSNNIQISNKVSLIDEIEKQFAKLIEDILNAIKEHKIKLINQIHSIEDSRMSVIQTYNLVSSKVELYKKIIEFQNNPQELENYIKDMIKKMNQSLESDEKKIKHSLEIYKNETQKINIKNIQDNIDSIIKNIKSTIFLQQSNQINSLIDHSSSSSLSQISQNSLIQSDQQNNQNPNSIIMNYSQIHTFNLQISKLCYPIQIQQPSQLVQRQIKIKSIQELQSIKNIQSYQNILITINRQSIGDNEMQQISNSLQGCQWINQLYLDLHQNNIGNTGVVHLSKALHQMKQLTHLTLLIHANQNISEVGIAELNKALQYQSHTMKYLDLKLGNNENINDSVIIKYIIPLISSYTKLYYLNLNLSGTKIGGNAIKQIGISLKSLSKLNTLILNLDDNQIQDDNAFISLSDRIFKLSYCLKKVKLFLNNNKISDECAFSVLSVFQICDELEELRIDLYSNNIGEECKRKLRFIESQMRNEFKNIHKFILNLDNHN